MKNILKKLNALKVGPSQILLLAVAGILLLSTVPGDEKESREAAALIEEEAESAKSEANELYIRKLENRLEQILTRVEGVGKTEVMITLKSSGEAVLNKDQSSEEAEEEESGDNKKRSSGNLRNQEETILSDENGKNSPYVVKTMTPEIAGVLIICEGAGSRQVASRVMDAAQAVLGVRADRISILKMKQNEEEGK